MPTEGIMLLLYSVTLLGLGLARWLWASRAANLERKYALFSTKLLEAAREPAKKPGNGNAVELSLAYAKRHFELGRLVQKRDALENRYLAWQSMADRLSRWLESVRTWKGQKLPYTLGALDVWLVLSLIDWLGVAQYVNAQSLIALVRDWIEG